MSLHLEKHWTVRALFWISLAGSYILAMTPQQFVPKLTPFGDKSNHFLAFAFLTLLILHAYRLKYISAFVWMLLYGIFIEISQLFAVNRSCEVLDVLADTLGIVIGLILYRSIRRLYPRC